MAYGDQPAWQFGFHWKKPTQHINPVGINIIKNVYVHSPGIMTLNNSLVGYGVEADIDSWRHLPPIKLNGCFSDHKKKDIVITDTYCWGMALVFLFGGTGS